MDKSQFDYNSNNFNKYPNHMYNMLNRMDNIYYYLHNINLGKLVCRYPNMDYKMDLHCLNYTMCNLMLICCILYKWDHKSSSNNQGCYKILYHMQKNRFIVENCNKDKSRYYYMKYNQTQNPNYIICMKHRKISRNNHFNNIRQHN